MGNTVIIEERVDPYELLRQNPYIATKSREYYLGRIEDYDYYLMWNKKRQAYVLRRQYYLAESKGGSGFPMADAANSLQILWAAAEVIQYDVEIREAAGRLLERWV